MMKRTSAIKMIGFRPTLSASSAVRGLATRALRLVQEVIRLLSRVVKGWPKSLRIETRVEEMTPVS